MSAALLEQSAVHRPNRVPAAVPAEFRGRARQYFAEVGRAEAASGRLLDAVLAPFRARIARGYKTFRTDALMDAARRWSRESPEFGRFGMTVTATRRCLTVAEVRAVRQTMRLTGWHAGEPALVIRTLRLDLGDGQCIWGDQPLAIVGFHAVARFFQRSVDDSEAALHDALVDSRAVRPDPGPGRSAGRGRPVDFNRGRRVEARGGAGGGIWPHRAGCA